MNKAKLLVLAGLFFTAGAVSAQVPLTTPFESQLSTISQRIDFTDITVTYSSPGVKGRKPFGSIVKYGEVWRAGANDNTVITFSTDVTVQGNVVKAGTYGLHVLPTESEWTFIFSSKTKDWGSYNYSKDFDVVRITVPVEKAPFTEWMQFNFTGRNPGKGRLELQWDEVKAGLDIVVDPALIVANFADQLRNRPGFSYLAYMQAANYLLGKNIQLEQAMSWADESIKREKRFDNQYLKSRILAKQEKAAERETVLAEALSMAKEADFSRVVSDLIREGNKARALSAAQLGAKTFATSWITQTAAGRAYLENGDKKAAKKAFDIALKSVPERDKKMVEELAAKAL